MLFQAMDAIETLNPPAFTDYLKTYSNTICGRHPIGILIQVRNATYLHLPKELRNNLPQKALQTAGKLYNTGSRKLSKDS